MARHPVTPSEQWAGVQLGERLAIGAGVGGEWVDAPLAQLIDSVGDDVRQQTPRQESHAHA
jgi:hypothetical protein